MVMGDLTTAVHRRRSPSQSEKDELCYLRPRFDLDVLKDAAFLLKHIWTQRDSRVTLEFCEDRLTWDLELYKVISEGKEGYHSTILNWPYIEHAISATKSDLTPSVSMVVGSDSLHFPEEVQRFLDDLVPGIHSVISDGVPLFDCWFYEGSASSPTDPAMANHIRGLRVPSLGRKPNLLLHDLGMFQDNPVLKARITNIFLEGNHTFLVNTSGSGKTRLLLEGLCENWGFYFTSLQDSSHLGSTDVQNAINKHLPDFPGFSTHLGGVKGKHRSQTRQDQDLDENRQIAKSIFNKVFLARLMIFDIFLTIMRQRERYEKNDHAYRLKWLHIQLRPSLLSSRTWDAFDTLTSLLLKLDGVDHSVNERTEALLRRIQASINPSLSSANSTPRQTPLFCVLDEAQHASSEYTFAFRSSSQPPSPRPVLREIVRSWQTQGSGHGVFMVVAGTGISMDAVDQAMTSAVMKNPTYRRCSDTGAFMSMVVQKKFIEKYLPQSLIQTTAGERLMQRIWHWLRGRHRFTAAFVATLLENGFQKPHTLLNRYIEQFTGFSPTDGQPFVQEEETLSSPVELRVWSVLPPDWDRMNEKMIQTVHCMTAHHLLGTAQISLGEDESTFVQYGFARFSDSAAGRASVDEPLIFLSISRWLNDYYKTKHMHKFWTSRISVHISGGRPQGRLNGFENFLAVCLHLAFSKGSRLSQVFSFSGQPPAWANQEARLVAICQPSLQSGFELDEEESILGTDLGPSPVLGMNAKTIEATLSWLGHDDHTAICFPDKLMGPDLLFVLRLQDGKRIWVALQAKFVWAKQIRLEELRKAVRSITPENFFVRKTGRPYTPKAQDSPSQRSLYHLENLQNRQKTEAGRYSLLRAIATFPGQANLERILSEDNDQHPLTSLNMGFIKELTRDIPPTEFLETMQSEMKQSETKSVKGKRAKRKMSADPGHSSAIVRPKRRKLNINKSIPSQNVTS